MTVGNDGTIVDHINDLDADGSTSGRKVVTTSANRLTVKTQFDLTGSGLFTLTSTDAMAYNADGSMTETRADTNQNGSLRDQTIVTTSGNGLSRTTTNDYDGNGATDLTTTDATVIGTNGSRTETVRDTNANGSLRASSAITTAANGLSVSATHDFDGNGTIDLTQADSLALNADGSTVETLTNTTIHGVRDQSTITTSADRLTQTVRQQFNGSVTFATTETAATGAAGNTVDTLAVKDASGAAIETLATTTSANGLTRTARKDVNGDGTFDLTTSDALALNADGSRTETVSETGPANAAIAKSVTTTSANGLTTTTQVDANGDGTFDLASTDATTIAATGGETETVSDRNADGSLRDQVVTVTSADRKTVTAASTLGPDGGQTDTATIGTNGTETETLSSRNGGGAALGGETIATSANQLSRTTTYTDAAGATLDQQTDATTFNSDGGKVEHFTDQDRGATSSDVSASTSANGLTRSINTKLVGAASFTDISGDSTVIGTDGGNTEHITDTVGGQVVDRAIIGLSANALVKTFQLDEKGDGTIAISDTAAYSTDGSKTETLTVANTATGAQQREDVITTSADGRTTSLQSARNGDAAFDHFETTTINPDGSVADSNTVKDSSGKTTYQQSRSQIFTPDGGQSVTITDFGPDGSVQDRTVNTVGASGLVRTSAVQTKGTGSADVNETDAQSSTPTAAGPRP